MGISLEVMIWIVVNLTLYTQIEVGSQKGRGRTRSSGCDYSKKKRPIEMKSK